MIRYRYNICALIPFFLILCSSCYALFEQLTTIEQQYLQEQNSNRDTLLADRLKQQKKILSIAHQDIVEIKEQLWQTHLHTHCVPAGIALLGLGTAFLFGGISLSVYNYDVLSKICLLGASSACGMGAIQYAIGRFARHQECVLTRAWHVLKMRYNTELLPPYNTLLGLLNQKGSCRYEDTFDQVPPV